MVEISEERCLMCGEVIPEGRMVCPNCEEHYKDVKNSYLINQSSKVEFYGDIPCEVKEGMKKFVVN